MARAIHPQAAVGFDRGGADYERGRPGYPASAIQALSTVLGIEAGRTVIDLAAGTGKLTRLLTATGVRLIAVEPVAGMREQLRRAASGIEVLDGSAEAIPLDTGSADAVVVAQAFHWFDVARAAAEIHRVLAPGGSLGVIWNSWDESVPWVARMQAIVHKHQGDTPRQATSRWPQELERTGLFTPLREQTFAHVVIGELDTLLARVSSVSYISALPDGDRAQVLDAVADVVGADPETAGRGHFAMPYTTYAAWCARLS